MTTETPGRRSAADQLIALSRSPAFIEAWKTINQRPLSFHEFEGLPMPEGFTPEDLWRLFTVFRRYQGVTLKIEPLSRSEENLSWTSIPKSSEEDLRLLSTLVSPRSHLSTTLRDEAERDDILLPPTLDEAWACARRDGLTLSREDLRTVWLHARAPRTEEEHLVGNFARLFRTVANYVDRPLTLTLAQDLHHELVHGVGMPPSRPPTQYEDHLYRLDRTRDPDYAALRIRAADEEGSSDSLSSIMIGAVELTSTFWNAPPFDRANSLVEYLMRRIYFLQRDLVPLSYVPLTHLVESDPNNFGVRYEANHWLLRNRMGTSEGFDTTIYYMGAIATYVQGMLEIERRVTFCRDEEHRLAASSCLATLNERQRDFMVHALRNRAREYSIQEYTNVYHVAYATAYHDLLELSQLGLLEQKKRGRAFYFSAPPQV